MLLKVLVDAFSSGRATTGSALHPTADTSAHRDSDRDGGARPLVPRHSRPLRPGPGRLTARWHHTGILLQGRRVGHPRRPRQARPLRHPRGEARGADPKAAAADVPGRARANRARLRRPNPRAVKGDVRAVPQSDGLGPGAHRALLRVHDPAAARARVKTRPPRPRRSRPVRLVQGEPRRQVETERGVRDRPEYRRDSRVHRRRHRETRRRGGSGR